MDSGGKQAFQTMFALRFNRCYCPAELRKTNMRKRNKSRLRTEPERGTVIAAAKNQGYQLPLHLWQDLVDEVSRRKRLGLPLATQNAIAVASISDWLERNKGMEG